MSKLTWRAQREIDFTQMSCAMDANLFGRLSPDLYNLTCVIMDTSPYIHQSFNHTWGTNTIRTLASIGSLRRLTVFQTDDKTETVGGYGVSHLSLSFNLLTQLTHLSIYGFEIAMQQLRSLTQLHMLKLNCVDVISDDVDKAHCVTFPHLTKVSIEALSSSAKHLSLLRLPNLHAATIDIKSFVWADFLASWLQTAKVLNISSYCTLVDLPP